MGDKGCGRISNTRCKHFNVYSEPHETIDKEKILPLRFWFALSWLRALRLQSIADKEL